MIVRHGTNCSASTTPSTNASCRHGTPSERGREIQRDRLLHGLAAKLDGEVVAIAHFLTHASTTSADVCYLQDLHTTPEARGKGIARSLIRTVEAWATTRGCARLYWHTKQDNQVARHLYDKVAENRGFIQYVMPLQPGAMDNSLMGT